MSIKDKIMNKTILHKKIFIFGTILIITFGIGAMFGILDVKYVSAIPVDMIGGPL